MNNNNKNQVGGKRASAGRKPLETPKEPVTVYIEKPTIEAFGGKAALRSKIMDWIKGGQTQVNVEAIPKERVDITEKVNCVPIPESGLDSEKKSFLNDEYPLSDETISPTENIPQTLQELKSQCPPELIGIDRSAWISEQRQKYNL